MLQTGTEKTQNRPLSWNRSCLPEPPLSLLLTKSDHYAMMITKKQKGGDCHGNSTSVALRQSVHFCVVSIHLSEKRFKKQRRA